MAKQHHLISVAILVSFALWINGQSTEHDFTSNDFHKNGSHWLNCTIDGKTHYDEDCFGWLEKFFTWIGLGLFVILLLMCGCLWFCLCTICRIICCSERPREVIYSTYVYPTTMYTQIPSTQIP